MKVSDIFDVSIGLSSTPAANAGFSVPLLLVDTTDVPVDRRYIITDRSSYSTDLKADSDAEEWATILWGQNYNPSEAYIGRWVSSATPAHYICGSPGTTIATWAAVTAGDFGLTIGGVPTVLVTTGTMAAVTSLADVAAIIQTAVQAEAGDYAACTVTVDALDRIVLSNSTTGSTSDAIGFTAPTGGAGTDISAANYLNISSGAFAVAGLDAEDPDDTMAAILALDNTPFIIDVRGASIAQEVDLATACVTYKKMCELRNTDADSKDSSATTDVPYQLSQLTNKNTHICYTEHTTQQPDAAVIGEIYARGEEGKHSEALNGLTSVYESGLHGDATTVIPLTSTERTALEDKGCDYLVNPAGTVHLRHGLTTGGVEVRHRVGLYWAEARISEGGYAFLLANNVVTFSDPDIAAIGGIANQYLQTLVQRKCIEDGYTLNLPSAADITATIKATHTLTLADMAALVAQYAVNDVVMTMSAQV